MPALLYGHRLRWPVLTPAMGLVCVMLACSGGGGTTSATIRATLLADPPFSESGINLAIIRKEALLTAHGVQVIAYFDAQRRIAIVFRDLASGSLVTRTLCNPMDERSMGDAHEAINMGYSSDGMLHLVYGSHATPVHYYRLRVKDLRSGTFEIITNDPSQLGLAAHLATYPQFYLLVDRLLITYRNDDDNSIGVSRYDSDVHQWQPWLSPFMTGHNVSSIYMNTIGIRENNIAVAYTIRFSREATSNQNLYIVLSRDAGAHWSNFDGTPLPVPFSAKDLSPAIWIPLGSKLINQSGAYLDSSMTFRVGFYRGDTKGIPQIFLLSFNLAGHSTVAVEQLTHRTVDFDVTGCGTLSLPISRPAVFELSSKLRVLYRENRDIILLTRSLTEWKSEVIYSGMIENWEPLWDRDAIEFGVLSMFVQGAEQGSCDTLAKPFPGASAQIIEFRDQ